MEICPTPERTDLIVWSESGERGVIVGNCHTHPGRFSVLWNSDTTSHPTSLYQLAEVSAAAEAWIAGFLAAHEPEPHELLGGEPLDDLKPDDFAVWQSVNREFQTTGKMPTAWLAQLHRDETP